MMASQVEKEITNVCRAINYLGFQLFKDLSKEEGNVFISPLSLSTALAMTFCGAKDETAHEMRKALGYEIDSIQDEEVKQCFQFLLSSLTETTEPNTLTTANVAFSQKDFQIKEDFKSVLEASFQAMIHEVDFSNETEAIQKANDWVSDKTNGMIPQLLESLDPATVMVILNAVYFKGFWAHQFEKKDTFLQYFYNNGIEDNAKRIEMMHLKETFPYVEKESFKALQLPYKGEELGMMLLLPNLRDKLQELESEVCTDFINTLAVEMVKTKVEVALPKFRLQYSKLMKNNFQNLGIIRAFECGAHFEGISESEKICISEIVHKAVLEVNEEGSEAAAATAVIMARYCISYCPEFIVDHPFLFLIYNLKNNVILFLGKVNEL